MRACFILLLLIAAAVMLSLCEPALAQCAMCKQTVTASGDADTASKGLNLAVLVLLLPPVAMFAGIFGMVYRHRNANDKQ